VNPGSSLRRALLATALGLLGLCLACGRSHTYLVSVEIPGDRPVNEKAEIARQMATMEAYERLRGEVRRQFPRLTERQLRDLVLSWRVYPLALPSGGEREEVALVVGFRYDDPAFDPKPIVDYCREVLSRQMREAGDGPAG
jgi:hypothetical protein